MWAFDVNVCKAACCCGVVYIRVLSCTSVCCCVHLCVVIYICVLLCTSVWCCVNIAGRVYQVGLSSHCLMATWASCNSPSRCQIRCRDSSVLCQGTLRHSREHWEQHGGRVENTWGAHDWIREEGTGLGRQGRPISRYTSRDIRYRMHEHHRFWITMKVDGRQPIYNWKV